MIRRRRGRSGARAIGLFRYQLVREAADPGRRAGPPRPKRPRPPPGGVVIERLQGFFEFTRTPFGRDLASLMLHRHASHGEAVARIGWCVTERRIGVITGEVGAGKTGAIRAALTAPDATPSLDRGIEITLSRPNANHIG